MNALNKWLTLLANFGVVAGLIFLAIEVNHSSRLAEVAAYQSRIQEIQTVRREIALSPELASMYEKFSSQGVD